MTDDDPVLEHVDECRYPKVPCTCPRNHLLAEGRRLTALCEFAENEFARENYRAVRYKRDRDRLRKAAELLRPHRDLVDMQATAGGRGTGFCQAVLGVVDALEEIENDG